MIEMQEIITAIKENRLIEAFTTGTAVTIGSICSFVYGGVEYRVPIVKELGGGHLTMQLFKDIQDIQYGVKEHPWSVIL